MYESYGTYVNAEYVDNHDYDGDTDDGTDDDTDDDTGDDTDDDTDDDNDHKKDSYTAAGAAPTQTRPGQGRGQARPSQAKPDPKNTLCLACFGMNGHQIGSVKF